MKRGGGVHTVPNPAGSGWANEVNVGLLDVVHRTKRKAVLQGRRIARRLKVEHTVHNADGRIGFKNSYGNDPYPPKDK